MLATRVSHLLRCYEYFLFLFRITLFFNIQFSLNFFTPIWLLALSYFKLRLYFRAQKRMLGLEQDG